MVQKGASHCKHTGGLLLKECRECRHNHKFRFNEDLECLFKFLPHFWLVPFWHSAQEQRVSEELFGWFRTCQRASEPQTPFPSISCTKCQITPCFLHIFRPWLPHPCSLLWACDKQPTRWHLRPSHWRNMYLFLKQEPWTLCSAALMGNPRAHTYCYGGPSITLGEPDPVLSRATGTASRSMHLAWEVPRPQSNVLETPAQRFWTLLRPQPLSFLRVSPDVERRHFARHLIWYLLLVKHSQWSVPILSMPLHWIKMQECEDLGAEPSSGTGLSCTYFAALVTSCLQVTVQTLLKLCHFI